MILLATVYVPGFAMVLDIVRPGLKDWAVIIGMSLIPCLLGQILKLVLADRIPGNHTRWLFMGGYLKKLIGGQ